MFSRRRYPQHKQYVQSAPPEQLKLYKHYQRLVDAGYSESIAIADTRDALRRNPGLK